MMRYDARVAVEAELKALGLFRGKEPRDMQLPRCSRSGDIIEPMVQPQWFVDCADMAKRSCDAVRDGSLKILPKEHEKTWFHWLENIQPWCISRQLWWGHRIPAYFATKKGEDAEQIDRNDEGEAWRWVVARSRDAAAQAAAAKLKCKPAEVVLEQDEDVLDTWFSSGLFPFSVFGWPDDTPDMKTFYPTSLLETGLDILFFWVARMVMMGLQLTDQLPFTSVYLHAMVRDKEGQKMSKSKGNVIDPLEVIYGISLQKLHEKLEVGNLPPKEVARAKEMQTKDFGETGGIPECGADALRIGLLAYTVQGRDINLDIARVVGYRNFCNKLWNATRFMLGCFGSFAPKKGIEAGLLKRKLAWRDRYILARLGACVEGANAALRGYVFGKLVEHIHAFFIYDLCDVYVELIKPLVYAADADARADVEAARATLWVCLDVGLRLLHPVCPFVTEELWQRMPGRGGLGEAKSIMVAPYPLPDGEAAKWRANAEAESRKELVYDAIRAARSMRADYALARKPAEFYVVCKDATSLARMRDQAGDFETLGGPVSAPTRIGLEGELSPPTSCAQKGASESVRVFVNLEGMVDFAQEIAKLEKQVAKLAPLIEKLEKKRADPNYLERASEKQQADDAAKLAKYAQEHADARKAIAEYDKLAKAPPKAPKAAKAAAAADDDDMDDMFGDDDEDEKPKEMDENLLKLKAAAEARLAKKEAAQKSMVVIEVKPWEADQDLNALWKKIVTEMTFEGLKWGEACQLVDVAFGIKKIVMSCVIKMDVSMDDVTEAIQGLEDEVQSVDIVSMNVL